MLAILNSSTSLKTERLSKILNFRFQIQGRSRILKHLVRSLLKSDPGIDNNNKIVEPFVLLIYRIKHQVSWSHHPASSSFAKEGAKISG